MRTRGWLAGGVLMMVLWAQVAAAQRVVVMEFQGDKKNKLRAQIEAALKKAGVVEVVSITAYRWVAMKRKMKPAQAMTPAGMGKLSRMLRLDAAVEGAIGATFFVRILDPSGQELWSKDLPLKRGLLSPDHAGKLAKAVAAAAKTEGRPAAPPAEAAPAPPAAPEKIATPAPAEEVDPDQPDQPKTPARPDLPKVEAPDEKLTREEKLKRRLEEDAEAHTETRARAPEPERDPDLEPEPTVKQVGPKLVLLTVTGTTTWRSYCSRPGVTSCKAYDALVESARPKGDTVDFSPQVPYAGIGINLDVFPLARSPTALRGLGVMGAYSRGFSLTNVRVQTPSGETPDNKVISIDQAFSGFLAYRYYLPVGPAEKRMGAYAGVRAGYAGRTFDVDPSAQVPLPGSHRAYPAFGLDLSYPFAPFVRAEGAFNYFVSPKPGAEEIAGYGDPNVNGGAKGSGLGFELGLAGDVWGPIGYFVRFKWSSYADQFFGAGQKWPCDEAQCGGAAQEVYSVAHWGLTAGF